MILGVVITALSFGAGHRGVHAVRSLLVPGAGLYDHRHLVLGVSLTAAAVLATYAWLRWGMDWSVVAVLVVSMLASAALATDGHPALQPTAHAAAHEFPLVVIVMGAISWLRLAWRRSPLGRRRAGRAEPHLALIDRCRSAALTAIAGGTTQLPPLDELARRCRNVGLAARCRIGGDPMRIDHAHVRAALALMAPTDTPATAQLRHDAEGAPAGVPASEPGWVRILDGTLVAIALSRAGDEQAGPRWAASLAGPFALRRGHRPAAIWTPLGLRGPRGATWEHAAASGLVRAAGWMVDDDDWLALRTRTFAAAARGSANPDDERLVAAARIWLRSVDDDQANRIIGRVTIHRDPIAVALDDVARALAADPHLLSHMAVVPPTRSTH
ncbi:MAG: hypothetical protein RJA49_1781 [Actinomycetota bacterium]